MKIVVNSFGKKKVQYSKQQKQIKEKQKYHVLLQDFVSTNCYEYSEHDSNNLEIWLRHQDGTYAISVFFL